VVVVGLLIFAGALVFMLASSSDRDDALASRKHAAHVLHSDRLASLRATSASQSERTKAQSMFNSGDAYLAGEQDQLTIADERVAEARTTQHLGADPSTPVDDYNASVGRGNDLSHQYDAKIQALLNLFDTFGRSTRI
jgi:hypothetical protein